MKTTVGSACLCALLITAGLEAYGAATNRYVVAPGTAGATPTPPYDSWETAGTNIIEVVNEANAYNGGDHVIISNGTYWLTNQVSITNTVVTNASGDRALVVVNGNFPDYSNRCFYLNNSAARVVCLTITNGMVTNDNGGGIYVQNGCVSNCVIAGNRAWMKTATLHGGGGGGIFMSGGEVSHCDIAGNTVFVDSSGRFGGGGGVALSSGGTLRYSRLAFNVATNGVNGGNRFNVGGGVYIYTAGLVDHCEIVSNACDTVYWMYGGGGAQLHSGGSISNSSVTGNYIPGSDSSGGGVSICGSGIIRNCVIAYNRCASGQGAVGMSAASGGRVENCTIVSNSSGIYLRDIYAVPISNVINCIVYWNAGTAIGAFSKCKTAMVACCMSPGYDQTYLNPGGTTNDPLLSGADFSLSSAHSSCYNHGVNLDWMTNATDRTGNRRIDRAGNVADIGACEFMPRISLFRTW